MKSRNYLILSAGIFASSMLGSWILFFVLPDARPLTVFEEMLRLLALGLMLPALPLILPAALILPPWTEEWAIVICSLISALLWPLLFSLSGRRTDPARTGLPDDASVATSGDPQQEFRKLLDEHRKKNS